MAPRQELILFDLKECGARHGGRLLGLLGPMEWGPT